MQIPENPMGKLRSILYPLLILFKVTRNFQAIIYICIKFCIYSYFYLLLIIWKFCLKKKKIIIQTSNTLHISLAKKSEVCHSWDTTGFHKGHFLMQLPSINVKDQSISKKAFRVWEIHPTNRHLWLSGCPLKILTVF